MTKITTWDPFREMARLSEEMNRLVGDVFGQGQGRESLRGAWVPSVDILEKEDAIVIRTDLPGLTADDVDVSVDNGLLVIRGERKFEDAAEHETLHRVERLYGAFERTFQLPRSVDPSKVKARFANGVLELTLPKREESRPRSIKIDVK